MTLTTDEIIKITEEVINGVEPSVTGPEADAFRKELEADIETAKKNGWTIELPFD